MDPQQYEAVCDAFRQAAALSQSAREEFLRTLGAKDEGLRSEVESMLEADSDGSRAEDAFADQAIEGGRQGVEQLLEEAETPINDESLGELIGPYRIRECLGHGGMGVVYLCEQFEPIRRRVAVKLIKLGMDSERIVQRFGLEREALERMEHPGIARLLDAGTDQAGRPYFAMEYVAGSSILEHCDERGLGIRERLELMLSVLRGLHHAHQRGILHRDLKPSNILVGEQDGDVHPKIIDFGLARAADASGDASLFTQTGELLGTPAYMSPEQLRGENSDLDVRSDVYAMGVLMFELLTGRLPFDGGKRAPIAALLERIKNEEKSPIPSSKVQSPDPDSKDLARNRASDPSSLQRILRGELDWIVMCAMESDRERRYGSALDFAKDIDAYLNHRPLAAGPPDWRYRVSKYVRRHRLALAAGGIVMASLMGATIVSAKSAEDARDSAEQAREAETQMGEMLSDVQAQNRILNHMLITPDPRYGGREAKVVDLMGRGVEFALSNYGDRPKVLAEVIGSLGSNYRELGMHEEAERLLRMALDFEERSRPINYAAVAYKQNGLGLLLKRRGLAEEAEEYFRQAIETFRKVELPDDPGQVGTWEFNLAKHLSDLGRWDEAERWLEAAMKTHELHREGQHIGPALILALQADLARNANRKEEALGLFKAAFERISLENGAPRPMVNSLRFQYARFAGAQEKSDEALELLLECLDESREIYGDEAPEISAYLESLTTFHLSRRQPELAEDFILEAVDLHLTKMAPDSLKRAQGMSTYGIWLIAMERWDDALAVLEEVLPIYRQHFPEGDSRLENAKIRVEGLRQR